MVRREKIRRPSGRLADAELDELVGRDVARCRAPRTPRVPTRGWRSPQIVLSVVVLPAPLAPIRVTISPRWTSRSIPRRAWIAP